MRVALKTVMLLALPACAGGASTTMTMHDWDGPPVHCSLLPNGGARVELVAPTAGHRLELEGVVRSGRAARVHVAYAPPAGDMNAQVVTTLGLDVEPEALGDARVVQVWVHGADGARQLVAAVARPAK